MLSPIEAVEAFGIFGAADRGIGWDVMERQLDSVPLPTADGSEMLAYTLVDFGLPEVDVEMLRQGQLRAPEAKRYLQWIESAESERATFVTDALRAFGFRPLAGLDLFDELTRFIVRWFPEAMAPYKGKQWVYDPDRGILRRGPEPTGAIDVFRLTFAHDIAFTMAASIRKTRRDLSWSIEVGIGRKYRRWASFWDLDVDPIGTAWHTAGAALLMAEQWPNEDLLSHIDEQFFFSQWPLRSVRDAVLQH